MKKTWKNCLIFIGVVLWFAFFALQGFDAHHDGVMLAAAAEAAKGKMLFSQVFCQYGPLAIWLQAVPVRLFGAEDAVIKLFTVLFYGGIALAGSALYAKVLEPKFRWIWWAFFLTLCPFYTVPFHPWSSVYALFFMLWGAHGMVNYFQGRGTSRTLTGAGALFALAFLCRTPCGLVSMAAATAALCVECFAIPERKKLFGNRLGSLCGGFGIVAALFALYLTAAGAWEAYFRQCGTFVFNFVVKRGGHWSWSQLGECLFPILNGNEYFDSVYTVLALTAIALLFFLCRGIFYGKRENIAGHLPEIFLILFALGAWHQYFPVPCVRHLYWGAVPFFGTAAMAVQFLWKSSAHPRLKWLLSALLFAELGFCIFPRCYAAIRRMETLKTRDTCQVPGLRGLWLFSSERDTMRYLYEAWQQLPLELKMRGVLNHTPDGIYSVIFPPAKFDSPMFVNWKSDVCPDYPEKVRECIRQYRPVVLSTDFTELPGYVEIAGFSYFKTSYKLLAPVE